MKKPLWIGLGALLMVALLAVLGYGFWLASRPLPVVWQGQVEATEVNVSAKVPGRIAQLHVRLGDKVERGSLICSLDSPEIRARLHQAEAARNAASSARRQAEAGARKEDIQAADNLWRKAAAAAELAEATLRRIERLHEEGVLPLQRLDEVRTQARAAAADEQAAKARFDLALAGAREEERDRATALQEQASAVVSEVESFLAETELRAPIGGEVSSLIAETGELVPAGFPVVTLVDLTDCWVVVHIREDDLVHTGLGSILSAEIPALGKKGVELEVYHLAALAQFATWRATSASQGFDLRTFELRARPREPLPGLRPGMTVLLQRP